MLARLRLASLALRFAAVTIAVAGVADPVITRDRPVTPLVTIAVMDEEAMPSARRLEALLGADYEISAQHLSSVAPVSACPAAGGCLVISSGSVPVRLTAGAEVVGALAVEPSRVIAAVEAPSRVDPKRSAVMTVHTRRPVKRLEVFDGDVLVGWPDGAASTETQVSWVPISTGARSLRVAADGDEVHHGVIVDPSPIPILFYEPHVTWLGTFVRRALEEGGRFVVRASARVAPSVTVSTDAETPLSIESLDDVGVVVVTAPESLSARDADLLHRFVAHRGGSVVLLPDREPAGPVPPLFPPIRGSHRESRPAPVGQLRATELLVFGDGPGMTTLERVGDRSVVTARALGRGRVIASGALDAWRHRGDNGDFQAFWQRLIHDAAGAAGAPLRITAAQTLMRPGEPVTIEIERQTMAAAAAEFIADGEFRCDGETGRMRVWPAARPGTFTATFRPSLAGTCRVTVSVNGQSAEVPLIVANAVRRSGDERVRLEAAIAAHGGILVKAGQEETLAARVRARIPAREEPRETWPMRSPLWLLPFVGCLSVEWWWRRRAGVLN